MQKAVVILTHPILGDCAQQVIRYKHSKSKIIYDWKMKYGKAFFNCTVRVELEPQVEKAVGIVLFNKDGSKKKKDFNLTDYPLFGGTKNRILFIIHELNRFLTIREIATNMVEKQPELDLDEVIDNIGNLVFSYKANGTLAGWRVGTSNRNTFYGLPHWVDCNGNIVSPHEYNKDAVVDKIDQSSIK